MTEPQPICRLPPSIHPSWLEWDGMGTVARPLTAGMRGKEKSATITWPRLTIDRQEKENATRIEGNTHAAAISAPGAGWVGVWKPLGVSPRL